MAEKSGKVFSLICRIPNFSLINLDNEQYFFSCIFNADYFERTKWSLMIYPDGNYKDAEGFISCFLCRKDEYLNDVLLSFKFEIADLRDDILKSYESKECFFSSGDEIGCSQFMNKREFKERLKALENDTLVIRCHVFNKTFQEPTMICKIRTEIRVEKRLFQCKFLVSKVEDWSKKICLPDNAEFNLNLTATDNRIHLKIQNVRSLGKYKRFKMKTSFLNSKDVAIKNSEFTYDPRKENNLPFETNLEKNLIVEEIAIIRCLIFFYHALPVSNIESYTFNSLIGIDPSFFKEPRLPLQDDLKSMFLNGKYCDVKFMAGSILFPAHRSLLSARSPELSKIFADDKDQSEVYLIDKVESDIFHCFLLGLYTDTVETSDYEKVLKLFALAHKFKVSSLKQKLSKMVKSEMSVENVCDVLVLANRIKQQDLKSFALYFIKNNRKAVLNSEKWHNLMINNLKLADEIFLKLADFD